MRLIPRFVLPFLALFSLAVSASAATVRLTTWNLNWFPNEGPEESNAGVQLRRIQGAANVLRPLNSDIILLQEIKDYDTCVKLAEAIKPGAYHVAICSSFRERGEIAKQQVAILAKENAQAAWSESWIAMRGVDPPRGFSFAWFKLNGVDLGVYSVHLKSNRPTGGGGKKSRAPNDEQAQAAPNIAKREVAIDQLLAHVRDVIPKKAPVQAVVVAGDFNTNRDEPLFAKETTLLKFGENGFRDSFEGLTKPARVTHPGSGMYPDTTFDYFFVKNATASRPVITRSTESDHLPVSCDIDLSKAPPASSVVAQPTGAPPPTTAAASPPNETKAAPPSPPPAPPKPAQDVQVWVHIPTGLYFRPGATLYGRSTGIYMKESEAISRGYKPAAVR
ncbi:MAG: endonuclease/exonuclease/phosphatase family protein [Chthoniobacterales bacterium]